MRTDDLHTLRIDIPAPIDDGACDHLLGLTIPDLKLKSTAMRDVNLAEVSARVIVLYCYPKTGIPDKEPPGGLDNWNAIPSARGCTPQSCAFRDHYRELRAFGAEVFGLSTQPTPQQQEMAERLHLPFEVLSDARLAFTKALRLPTFDFGGEALIKRLTLVIEKGRIIKVFYPVFPPDKNAEEVMR